MGQSRACWYLTWGVAEAKWPSQQGQTGKGMVVRVGPKQGPQEDAGGNGWGQNLPSDPRNQEKTQVREGRQVKLQNMVLPKHSSPVGWRGQSPCWPAHPLPSPTQMQRVTASLGQAQGRGQGVLSLPSREANCSRSSARVYTRRTGLH